MNELNAKMPTITEDFIFQKSEQRQRLKNAVDRLYRIDNQLTGVKPIMDNVASKPAEEEQITLESKLSNDVYITNLNLDMLENILYSIEKFV